MTPKREPRDVPASIRQRLLNVAQDRAVDFNLVLQRYSGERFLYRLGLSNQVDRFTLKGAALFLIWAGKELRATRDIDLLGSPPADWAVIQESIEEICAVGCPQDGVRFDPATIRVADIREEQPAGGIRVKLRANLGTAILPLQVDVGFGDVISPERQVSEYPTLLDHPAPRVWTYPRETFVAEKFEAMVRLGPVNTRMKDFWDVVALARQFRFDGETLRTAIDETFRHRGTELTAEIPPPLRPDFYQDPTRIQQWSAFQERTGAVVEAQARFYEVGEQVHEFLGAIRESLVLDEPFYRVWPAGGPWQAGRIWTEQDGSDV